MKPIQSLFVFLLFCVLSAFVAAGFIAPGKGEASTTEPALVVYASVNASCDALHQLHEPGAHVDQEAETRSNFEECLHVILIDSASDVEQFGLVMAQHIRVYQGNCCRQALIPKQTPDWSRWRFQSSRIPPRREQVYGGGLTARQRVVSPTSGGWSLTTFPFSKENHVS